MGVWPSPSSDAKGSRIMIGFNVDELSKLD